MKRQFVWIMTDTTGSDMVGCYGNPDMHTPYLDAMARQGVRFERAYTTQPVCGPARSSLFTGMYPHSNGSWGNSMALGADVLTLGQRLSSAGIACGYIGKWHLDAGDYFGNGICPDGWEPDYWYDMKCYLDELTDAERLASRDYATCQTDSGVPREFTYAYRVTQRALKFIEAHKQEDFFLVVSYDEPHDPSLCPAPYNHMFDNYQLPHTPAFDDTLEGKPLLQRLWAAGSHPYDFDSERCGMAALLNCNAYVDSEIGRVLGKCAEAAPGSLRMFTSDHGDGKGSHRIGAKGPCVYDEIARIPLIFMGDGVPAGAIYPHTVSHIDLPATVMNYMGLDRPAMFEGESLLAQVQGDPSPTGRTAFIEFTRYEIDHDSFGGFQPMRAAVNDRYKLALHLTDIDEFYDEQSDPYDMDNRIDDPECAAERNALHDKLLDWMNTTRDPFRGYQWKCRTWRSEYVPSWRVDGMTRQRRPDPGEYTQLDYSTGQPITSYTRIKPGL